MADVRVTDAMRDDKTPDEVEVTSEAHAPYMDPTLGVPVAAEFAGTPRHRLVTIGDSLTHGFQSGAISNTAFSYPAIIAYELGWLDSFRFPTYAGFGGLPLNIEFIIRQLEREFGDKIDWWEAAFAGFRIEHILAEIEDWWERGPGSIVPARDQIMHNLAVYGWDLRDILERNATIERTDIQTPKQNGWFQLVENANERAALRVVPGAARMDTLTPLQAAAALGTEGSEEDETGEGIETLVVMIGANNALGSVVSLKVAWSEEGYDDLKVKNRYTVWNPVHFAAEFALVVEEIAKIPARHVILATVPHVTIAPVAHGVDRKVRQGSRFFPYYTRPWIQDPDFDATVDPHITEQEARAIDSAIDQYNAEIAAAVKAARKAGRDWYLLDICGMLDRLASRRYLKDISARPVWWNAVGGAYPLPPDLQNLAPPLSSGFFASGPGGRTGGGLFALDGVHPTTVSYGLIAQEIINIMVQAGVTFQFPDGKTERKNPVLVDFKRLIAADTLITDPPRSLSSDLALIGWLDSKLDMFRRLLRHGA